MQRIVAHYHLPGLFEFYDFYRVFLPLWKSHREYFYDWCDIGSIYGAPANALWGGGRVGFGDDNAKEVFKLLNKYRISARLTFSNSLLALEHLADKQCNGLCELIEQTEVQSGVIVHSDLLADYISRKYPNLYLVSSTTKVITEFAGLLTELNRDGFKFVVPDFRLNKELDKLNSLPDELKKKVEFLCNECCWFDCHARRSCYENVSRKVLGIECEDHVCVSPDGKDGYVFSKAMKNPAFIGVEDIINTYLPMGFTEYKIEGRSLGSALLLEFILYYMTKPQHQLEVREAIYLDASLDLF